MRSRTTIVGLFGTLAATSCDLQTPPTGHGEIKPTANAAILERPFHGQISGVLTVVPPFAPGSNDDCNANFTGDPAAPGASVSVFDQARGSFAHLGLSQLHAVSCVDPTSPLSSGEGTITAANGDRLLIAFSNKSSPHPTDPARLLVSGTQQVKGGTGRFQGAHGEQECSFTIVLLSPSTGRIEGQCHGTLVY